ncbi:hypothetical protein RF11_10047 [Thelohanellus kitauei]|uniref:Uncharacterized protein n=1 Tax=Thelohanellus kitauei TaxID=669202 RepID=A0A0C2IJQ3_THEKT|nr:hypothetical protein RF11_10047 [Thelohanellus kitauei]
MATTVEFRELTPMKYSPNLISTNHQKYWGSQNFRQTQWLSVIIIVAHNCSIGSLKLFQISVDNYSFYSDIYFVDFQTTNSIEYIFATLVNSRTDSFQEIWAITAQCFTKENPNMTGNLSYCFKLLPEIRGEFSSMENYRFAPIIPKVPLRP